MASDDDIDPFLSMSGDDPPEEKPISAVDSFPEITGEGDLTFDFEVVPDELNYPRPTENFSDQHIDTASLKAKKLDGAGGIYEYVESGNFATVELEKLKEWESTQDKPRKGLLECLMKLINARQTALTDWAKDCSTDPLKCRIVAAGWAEGLGDVNGVIIHDEEQEKRLLTHFWKMLSVKRRRMGYNILSYDDLVLIRRSIVLGVAPTIHLDRRKYGNPQAIDLQILLFPNGSASKCKEVAKSFGIHIPAGDMDGSKVFEYYQAGRFDELRTYVKSDVHVEREIYFAAEPFLSI